MVRITFTLLLCCCLRVASAHEFWIEARAYQVESGAPIEAGLYNGQMFKGVELAWFKGRIKSALWAAGAQSGVFEGRSGDRPALRIDTAPEGLVRLIYQSAPSELSYSDWEKFVRFVETKGSGWAVARHGERGLPQTGFKENYTRYSKALIAAGGGAGADKYSGMIAELTALTSPYEAEAREVLVEMRWRDEPLAGATIDVFEKAGDAVVSQSQVIADSAGRARIALTPGRRYLINAVVLEEVDGAPYVWESHWASLTFAVPE
jgi:uncharacterized GH25 family protein